MVRSISRIASAAIKSGPKAVALTRGAKQRGAKQKTREFAALIAFLAARDLSVVVEIGTLHGGTLWTWCRLARSEALIVSIDLPGGSFGGGYEIGKSATLRGYAGPNQSVILIREDSHVETTKAILARALDGREIDFLFIDGDHAYDGVKLDFEMYAPLVRHGGVIALHDILHHPSDPTCQVDVFWNHLKTNRDHVELIDCDDLGYRGQWGGIGVVFGGDVRDEHGGTALKARR